MPNQRMAMKFSSRTFDGIKSHRRQERYQALVEEMLTRSDGPTQRILDQDGVEPVRDDRPVHVEDEAAQPEPIDARSAISEELLMLVNKPPPRAFQGYRLWEITKRFLNGGHVGSSLDSYLMEVFTDTERAPKRPRAPPAESRRKRKRREYATCQNLVKKNRSQCIRGILDETGSSQVEDPVAFLEEWQEVLEAPPSDDLFMRNRGVIGTIDPRVLITAQDIKSAMPLRNTASGPDGSSAKRLHSCPLILLRVLLNLLIMQKRLPLILCNARTIFIPKVPGASTASLHRPITVSHVLTRLLHKVFQREARLPSESIYTCGRLCRKSAAASNYH
ncbi:hypothetical protein MTO96_032986 [Rhipicephalus appendiculatus]